jgi:hypothetical protein
VTSVTLFLDDIRNWTVEPNQLYIHLLPDATVGVTKYFDNEGGGDNYTHVFTAAQLATFVSYAGNGNFGLGFDPDCHYFNNGIKLTVETTGVPEPGTLILLGSGLLGIVAYSRRKAGRP